jgi:hypothetical protein
MRKQSQMKTSYQKIMSNHPVCKTCNKERCEDRDGSIILCSEKRVKNGKSKK